MGVAHSTRGNGRSRRASEVCAICVFLRSLAQLTAVFCLYLVFLVDKIMHNQRQNYYAQIVPQYINHIGTNLHFPAELTVPNLWDCYEG